MNETVQRLAYHAGHFFKRHASSILAGAAAVGVIATAVAVATETPKAMKQIRRARPPHKRLYEDIRGAKA